ncbi:MAG: response regulator, partial [Clostridiales bacterium]|nr:response regulator [Clostridiales bacterium]
MYKILLVDDEALEREALRIIIERGFSNVEVVGEARFGSEAIILDGKLNPDIILMDIKMPGINGIEATYTIKNRNRDKYIIILTAYDE